MIEEDEGMEVVVVVEEGYYDSLRVEEQEGSDKLELDLDYEFDAVRFFDFSRPESEEEARASDRWFDSAQSYPPSPFLAALKEMGSSIFLELVNTISKTKGVDNDNPETVASESPEGDTQSTRTSHDALKNDKNSISKRLFSRASTLMKPTASQLAKQNQRREMKSSNLPIHRFPKPVKIGQSHPYPCDSGVQAAKRQKLEGGHLFKVVGVSNQSELLHKPPQKKNDPPNCNPKLSRLKITIPREPELQTARRAQRLRLKNNKHLEEETSPTTPGFKACPLNKEIFSAPSFPVPQNNVLQMPQQHETLERVSSHCSAASFSQNPSCSVQSAVGGSRRLKNQSVHSQQLANDCKKPDAAVHFKARPFDKKIILSKGDMGVFRSVKNEVTKPKEFNLSSGRRCDLPVELFNKLSLNSGAQRTSLFEDKLLQPPNAGSKGPKENVIAPLGRGKNKGEVRRRGSNEVLAENIATHGIRSQLDTYRRLGVC